MEGRLAEIGAILELAQQVHEIGIGTYSFLEGSVSNKRQSRRYLKHLLSLGWLQSKARDERASSIDSVGWKTIVVYDPADKGRAFLELFPMEER